MSLYVNPFNIIKFNEKVNKILYPNNIDLESLILDHSLDYKKINNWISLFNKKNRSYAKEIIDGITHISWLEFKTRLFTLAIYMTHMIKGQYGFVSTKKGYKSNSFFTSIVYNEILSKWRQPYFSDDNLENFNYDNIVIIDDASYSGSQLLDTLAQFYKMLIEMKFTYNNKISISIVEGNRNFINKYIGRYSLLKNNEYILIYSKRGNYISYELIKKINSKIDVITYEMNDTKTSPKLFLDIMKIIKSNTLTNVADISPLTSKEKLKILTIPDLHTLKRSFNVYLCIPYISKQSYNKLLNFEYIIPNIKLHYPEYTDYSFKKPNELLENYLLYGGIGLSTNDIYPIYFDHKLASPVSTLSVILGCGFVVDIDDDGYVESVKIAGSLLKNCPIGNLTEMKKFSKLYKLQNYDPNLHEDICIECPKTIYKLKPKEVELLYYRMKLKKVNRK